MHPEIDQFQQWLRRRSPHASTHIHYASDLHKFFGWADKPLEVIIPADVDDYIDHCQAAGHAIATINRRTAAIRSFYRFLALFHDEATPNPIIPQRHHIRPGRPLPRDVDDDRLVQLFSVINHVRDRAMFLLMLRCGLRVSEVRALSLGDCYFSLNGTNLPRLWVHGKGNQQRIAYLSNQMVAVLQAWLAVRPSSEATALFLNRFGRRLTVTGIQDRLAYHCRQAGLWLTCHQLRHTFARHLIEAAVPVTTIQKLLGHARLRTTETYLHIADGQVQSDYQAAIAVLAKRLPLGEVTP